LNAPGRGRARRLGYPSFTGSTIWQLFTKPGLYATRPHPSGLYTRSVDAGNFASFAAGRTGRLTSSPPQFGHTLCNSVSAQVRQNVHSKEHITASRVSGGRSRLQHSQFGFSLSIVGSRSAAAQ
jgi:hypothetical protein